MVRYTSTTLSSLLTSVYIATHAIIYNPSHDHASMIGPNMCFSGVISAKNIPVKSWKFPTERTAGDDGILTNLCPELQKIMRRHLPSGLAAKQLECDNQLLKCQISLTNASEAISGVEERATDDYGNCRICKWKSQVQRCTK